MKPIRQHVALGATDNEIYLFVDLNGTRDLLASEKQNFEHPFIKFANASNLPEFLAALDEIYDEYVHMPFFRDLMEGYRPSSVGPERAAEVAKLFEGHPSRTTIQKTSEALEVWYFDNMEPSEECLLNAESNNDMILYTCMPLKDLIEAKDDLRRTANLLAWLLGKTTFDMAHGLIPGDKSAEFKILPSAEGEYLAEYYNALQQNSGNTFVNMNLHSVTNILHLYREKDIEDTVRSYVQAAFSLLMSDETSKMSYDLRPFTSSNTILSCIWSFFAFGLNESKGMKAIGVCKYCGRFFQQTRLTKQYCGDSCRVSYMKKFAGQPKPEIQETKLMQLRQRRAALKN